MGHVQLAMPLFLEPAALQRPAVVGAWQQLFPGGPPLLAVENKEGVDEYKVDGKRSVLVAHIGKPIPLEEALSAIGSSWMWQKPDDAVRSHSAHAIVTATDAKEPVRAAWDVARVCAALLTAGTGAALYWGSGRQMHAVDLAIAFASEKTTPPIPLLVGITISGRSSAGPFSATTHGLEALGHKEFEVRDTSMKIGDLRMTLLDLAGYVVASGPVLKHGQTFGPDAKARWSIKHERSRLVDGRDAIVLGIP